MLIQLSKIILNFMSESVMVVFWWFHHFWTLLWQCIISSSQHSHFLKISKVTGFLELWFPSVFMFNLKPNLNTVPERNFYIITHSTATKVLNCSCGHNSKHQSLKKKVNLTALTNRRTWQNPLRWYITVFGISHFLQMQ